MRGDRSILTDPAGGFSADDVAACVERRGLLSFELLLSAADRCDCRACQGSGDARSPLAADAASDLIQQAKAVGARACKLVVDPRTNPQSQVRERVADLVAAGLSVEVLIGPYALEDELVKYLIHYHVAITLGYLDEPAIALCRAAGYTRGNGPPLSVWLYASDEIDELIDVWRRLRRENIDPRLQVFSPAENPSLPPARWKELVAALYCVDRDEFSRAWPVPPPHAGRSNMRHLYSCHIAPCGTVYASAGLPIPLGTVRTESLREILELSEVLENLRAYRTKVKEPCRTCSQSVACYGSRGAAYAATGDYLAGDPLCERAADVVIQSLPVDVVGLVPHGPSIRMVDQLTAVGERRTRTSYTVRSDSAFVDESGRLDETAYIEMIAQSFAASHGFHLPADERAMHRGLLIGVKDLEIAGQAKAGDRLTIDVRKVARFGDFGVVDGTIHHEDGRFLARGQIKVWRPGDDAAKAMIV